MRQLLIFATLVMLVFATRSATAGLFEIGAQANYRSTNFDATHSEASETGTGSLAYYFWGLSALEISYTRGASLQNNSPEYQAYEDFTGYGLDLMITFANQNSSLKPYLKVGAAYVDKNLREFFPSLPAISIETRGIAPSAGMGFKLMMGQQFALKAGFEVSTSPVFLYYSTSPDPNTLTYDFSANGGLSFFF
jgi:hypothetical protein